jgi:four helix bundle protein
LSEPAKTFTQLVVWRKAHAFVLEVYCITGGFPKSELYGLTDQFRRAAVSIAANIAEGFRKKSKLDKIRFFNISEGSLEECRYYLILARDLKYVGEIDVLWALSDEIGRLLNSYAKAIQAPNS